MKRLRKLAVNVLTLALIVIGSVPTLLYLLQPARAAGDGQNRSFGDYLLTFIQFAEIEQIDVVIPVRLLFLVPTAVSTIVAAIMALALLMHGGNSTHVRVLSLALASATFAYGVLVPLRGYGIGAELLPVALSPLFLATVGACAIAAAVVLACRFAVEFPRGIGELDLRNFFASSDAERSLLPHTGLNGVAMWLDRDGRRSGRGRLDAGRWEVRSAALLLSAVRSKAALIAVSVSPVLITLAERSLNPDAEPVFGPIAWPAVLTLAAGIAGGGALRVGFFSAGPTERRQLLWLFWGVMVTFWGVIALGCFQIAALITSDAGTASVLMGLMIVSLSVGITAALAVALFYDGAIEPAVALRRTTLYGLRTTLIVFAYATTHAMFSDLVEARFPAQPSAAAWIAAGVVAALYAAFRHRVRGMVRYVMEGPQGTPAQSSAARGLHV